MMAPHAGLERRVLAALDATPAAHPGRARRLRHRPHHAAARAGRPAGPRPVPVHRRRARRHHARALPAGARRDLALHAERPEPRGAADAAASARDGVRSHAGAARAARARTAIAPATFLLDEVLELRTFESFPGLRHVLRELLQALADSGNRFVLTSRYVDARAPAAARRPRALRGDPPAARSTRPRSPPCCRRSATTAPSTTASSSAAPSRRSPTAAPRYVRALGEATAAR